MIAAIGLGNELGFQDELLWQIREDLQNFKKVTAGHYLIIGKKTFLTLNGGLPGRPCIVLSRQDTFQATKPNQPVLNARTLSEAINIAHDAGEQEVFVVGGGVVYQEALLHSQKIYLSEIQARAEKADAFFPVIDPKQWRETERVEYPAKDGNPSWIYRVLERV